VSNLSHVTEVGEAMPITLTTEAHTMPRISDTKIERALLKMQKEADLSAIETASTEQTKYYRLGRAHMIADVIRHLQSEDFYLSLDRD
jgi:hypothetical protein